MRRHGRWPSKPVYSFYLNLITDLTQVRLVWRERKGFSNSLSSLMLQLFLYLVFFAIVLSYYGMPLHIVRELYNTFASFQKRISDFVRYR